MHTTTQNRPQGTAFFSYMQIFSPNNAIDFSQNTIKK